MPRPTMWGIHMAQLHGAKPIEQGYVAIGWQEVGDPTLIDASRDAFKARFARIFPEKSAGAVPVEAGVLFRFVHEMREGDIVVYPSKADRMVNIGVITGGYRHLDDPDCEYPNLRPVRWVAHLPRTSFKQAALNEIGSAVTLFQIKNHAVEFAAAMEGNPVAASDAAADETEAEHVSAQVEESTEDFIVKRLKLSQTPYQFEHFVAHLLRCMGYHARVTKASGDGGIDIIAHRDELGFEPPIIKVQCKQIVTTIGRPEIQQLHGAIEPGEHGLFVTLGGFSADAKTFERGKPNLRLIDGPTLIALIYDHYHQFEPRYQTLLPLRRVYIPGLVTQAEQS